MVLKVSRSRIYTTSTPSNRGNGDRRRRSHAGTRTWLGAGLGVALLAAGCGSGAPVAATPPLFTAHAAKELRADLHKIPFKMALPTWLPSGWAVTNVYLTPPPSLPTGGLAPFGHASVMFRAAPKHGTAFVFITELVGHGHITSTTVHEDGYTLQESPPAPPNMWRGVLVNGLPHGVSGLLSGPKDSFSTLNHIAVMLKDSASG